MSVQRNSHENSWEDLATLWFSKLKADSQSDSISLNSVFCSNTNRKVTLCSKSLQIVREV